MRDPARIYKFCSKLGSIWQFVPDWRFGQLVCNALGEYANQTKRDPFFTEDDEMLEFIETYIKKCMGIAE